MSREEYLKNLILAHDQSLKKFSKLIDLPYSTLLGMLKNGQLGGASVDNVIKVCRGLGITVDDLQQVVEGKEPAAPFYTTQKEQRLVTSYRERKQLQTAVDILLGVAEDGGKPE